MIVDYDTFDFNSGDMFPPRGGQTVGGWAGFPTLIFDELNLLKKCEGAKDYHQKAEWERKLFVKIAADAQRSGPGFYKDVLLNTLFTGP